MSKVIFLKCMLRRINPWWYVFLSGFLLFIAWPPLPVPFLVFFAFVPLLLLEDHHYRVADRPLQYYFQIALTLTLWNAATTYWTWFASPSGALAAILLNAQFQSLPWLLFHRTRKIFGDKLAYPALVGFSLTIEYLHFNWDIAWPWLNMGNIFANATWAVQWYELTGIQGGSLWVYGINILFFFALTRFTGWKAWIKPVFWIIGPLALSAWYWSQSLPKTEEPGSIEVLVIQPNIDPYTDKFDGMSPEEQFDRLMRLSDSLIGEETRLVLWPETALTEYLDEGMIEKESVVRKLQRWVDNYPKLTFVTGASTIHYYREGEKRTSTSREISGAPGVFYDSYNTALAFRAGEPLRLYHKSKLVPGVEKMPYPKIFGFLESMAIDLGGTSGSLGRSDSAVVFAGDGFTVAPIICYESVFGEYVGQYVKNGANILGIITNDGWWKDTPGYRQHFLYARLRAIENRMYVARSANTGVSGFIDPQGNVMSESKWWTQDAIIGHVYPKNELTFYAQSGDYLGRMSAFLAVLVILAGFVKRKTARGY